MATATITPKPVTHEQGVTQEQHAVKDYVRDERVNRFTSPARVAKLRAELDLEAIGMAVVSKRENGDLVILDAAHRCTALIEEGFGDIEMPALVHHNLSMAREAELFLRYNDRLAVDILEKFRFKVQAEDPESTILDREIREAGFSVSKGARNKLMAIAALQAIYRGGSSTGREGHRKVVRETLETIRDSWGIERTATKQTLTGIGAFLLHHGDKIDRVHLVKALAKAPGGASWILTRAHYHTNEGGKRAMQAAELAVAEAYNDGLAASKRIKVTG